MLNFAAIDFETANSERSSVCAVGVVIVRDGEFVDSFYSLIQPEPNYYNYWCSRVHGLCCDDTDDAPIFPEVWKQIEPRGMPARGLPNLPDGLPWLHLPRHPACLATQAPPPQEPPAPHRRRRLWLRPQEPPPRPRRRPSLRLDSQGDNVTQTIKND